MDEQLVYLDNPATSFPKPPEVLRAMTAFTENVGANPGRSGHRLSIESARIVYAAREAIAEMFHAPDPTRIIFGQNVTDAINLALMGLLHPGDHVITSSMEHNAVMRPLRALEQTGVTLSVIPCAPDGSLDPQLLENAIRPETVLIVINHASNVNGTILPARAAGAIATRRGLLFLCDVAQTGGILPIDMQADGIDLLAFTGHKGLYGPMGTGGLIIGERVDLHRLKPLRRGGTGSRSELEIQPEFLPDRFESGTLNAVGLAGLNAAVRWLLQRGISTIHQQEQELTSRLLDELRSIPGVQVYTPPEKYRRVSVISFNIQGIEPSEVGFTLDDEFGILSRVGLHCAPAAHRTLGTFPSGTVRFGLSAFTTPAEIELALQAVQQIARRQR
ncbi:MAG TPA: aminotransferase class V-fold PLP-dependent enzyme [Anaerolineaceae bacterium]